MSMYTNLSFSSPGYIETASGAPRLSRDPQQPQQTLPPHREIRQELVEKRQTQHIIIETTSNQFFIISRLSTRKDVQLIKIDSRTGGLRYSHQPRIDLFESPSDAIEYIEMTLRCEIKSKIKACALLGYLILENVGCLLVATRATSDGLFMEKHYVYTVEETRWIRIPLTNPIPPNRTELRNFETLSEFNVDSLHFYCETCDMTRSFPSTRDKWDYDHNYAWNDFLSEPFSNAGLREWCPVLLQGSYRCRYIDKAGAAMCLISRKHTGHPGTRFYARGLNDANCPGNEIECDIIMWTKGETENDTMKWCRFTWRRGTVPVRWKSDVKTVGEADIVIRATNPYEGCDKYVDSLVSAYGQPLYILNLLKTDPDKSEFQLSECYQQAIRNIKKATGIDATVINYDWHMNLKTLGNYQNIEGIWCTMKTPLERIGLSSGTFKYTGTTENELDSSNVTIDKKQTGVVRTNCADSLDRTNIVIFFICYQVIAEMCNELSLPILESISPSPEKSTESTTPKGWNGFSFDYRTLNKKLESTELIQTLADFFIYTGDICSLLYTNSLAAHSGPMREHSFNMDEVPSNAYIAVVRRYQNILHDQVRQTQYEMFCGLFREKYFPSTLAPKLELVSDLPGFILNKIPSKIPLPSTANRSMLIQETKKFWVIPDNKDSGSLTIMLRRPAELREILITYGPTVDPRSDPHTMDLSIGFYLNDMKLVYSNLPLPIANPCAELIFPVPPSVWDTFDEFYRPTGNRGQGYISRFVRITFHRVEQLPGAAGVAAGSMPPLSFGRIELYGRTIHPSKDNLTCAVPDLPPQPQESEEDIKTKEKEYKSAISKAIDDRKVCFDTALELEVLRLRNKISPVRRDEIMTSLGLTNEFSPLTFMYKRDEKIEDEMNSSLRKICCKCQNRYFITLCAYCKKMYCKNCMDFKSSRITEYSWDNHDVCKDCYAVIARQSSLLERITSLHKANIQEQVQKGTKFAGGFISEFQHHKDNFMISPADSQEFKSAEMSLAVYPYAALVNDIPCDKDSSIPEIMLTPGYSDKYWAAPAGLRTVDITVGLPSSSILTHVKLTPGPLGYNEEWEVPSIKIKAAETLNEIEFEDFTDCSVVVENAKEPNCVVKGTLDNSISGRIIIIRVSLPESAPQEARIHIGKMIICGKSLIPVPLDDETGANGARFTVPDTINERAFLLRKQQCFIPVRAGRAMRKTKGFTDIYINATRSVNIHGFTVTIEHGGENESSIETQVRLFRVSVIVMAQEKALSKIYVGLFPIPKCAAGTTLVYRFEDIVIGNMVRLEHVSNYGSRETTTPGKIAIF